MTRNDPNPTLAFGQFFGDRQSSLEVRGFALAHLAPTVPEREVVRHTHEEGALRAGDRRRSYLSSARDAPALCTAPTADLQPPGHHSPRLLPAPRGGRFFTISVAGFVGPGATRRSCTDPARFRFRPPAITWSSWRGGSRARALVSGQLLSRSSPRRFCLELLARTSWSFDREPPSVSWVAEPGRELLRDSLWGGRDVDRRHRGGGGRPSGPSDADVPPSLPLHAGRIPAPLPAGEGLRAPRRRARRHSPRWPSRAASRTRAISRRPSSGPSA